MKGVHDVESLEQVRLLCYSVPVAHKCDSTYHRRDDIIQYVNKYNYDSTQQKSGRDSSAGRATD